MTKIFSDRRFAHHQYKMTPRFGSHHHDWVVHCEQGAVNFHVSIVDDGSYEPSCGMEFHSRTSTGGPPSHVDCGVIKGPCWHDGTSMYASRLWEDLGLRQAFEAGNHDAILQRLELEAFNHWSKDDEET